MAEETSQTTGGVLGARVVSSSRGGSGGVGCSERGTPAAVTESLRVAGCTRVAGRGTTGSCAFGELVVGVAGVQELTPQGLGRGYRAAVAVHGLVELFHVLFDAYVEGCQWVFAVVLTHVLVVIVVVGGGAGIVATGYGVVGDGTARHCISGCSCCGTSGGIASHDVSLEHSLLLRAALGSGGQSAGLHHWDAVTLLGVSRAQELRDLAQGA